MKDLTSTAKKLDKVFSVADIVLFALTVASVVFIVLIALAYVLGWDPEFIGTGYASFDVGFLELEVAEEHAPDKWLVLGQVVLTLVVGCRILVECRRGVSCIRGILNPMMQGQPFDSTVSMNLKKLAKISIVLGILWNIVLLAEQIMVVFVYELPGLLISEKITHVDGVFQLDLTFVACWAVLLLLSYVFRYGEQLQQLSDETL